MMALVTGHLRAAWSAYRATWRTFLAGSLVLIASWLALERGVIATMQLGVVSWLALHTAFLVIFSGLLVGMHRMALDAIDGASPNLRDLDGSLRDGPTLLVAALIHALAIAVGLLLLVLPGV